MPRRPIFISHYDHHRLRQLLQSDATAPADPVVREHLQRELERAIVVPQHVRVPSSVVTVDSRVIFEDLDDGTVTDAILTLPERADPAAGRLSIFEAIGTALLGYGSGDVITFRDQKRERRIRILRVVRSSLAEARASLVVA